MTGFVWPARLVALLTLFAVLLASPQQPREGVVVTTPDGKHLRYRVTGHAFVGRHSGSAAGLIRRDLTLQTCRGHGTALTYARRVA